MDFNLHYVKVGTNPFSCRPSSPLSSSLFLFLGMFSILSIIVLPFFTLFPTSIPRLSSVLNLFSMYSYSSAVSNSCHYVLFYVCFLSFKFLLYTYLIHLQLSVAVSHSHPEAQYTLSENSQTLAS